MESAPPAPNATRTDGSESLMRRVALARQPWLWVFVGVWAVFVSALHFGGLAYDIYTKIWWWDLLTHSLSGFGVAGVLFLVLPMAVAAIGTWFEVYERLFTDFWVNWSLAYYLEDTAVDIVADTAGAVVFGIVRPLWDRVSTLRRDPNRL
ncbi:hypothetical protein SAMN04488691_11182 [Haloferax larsenii]|uniref:Uncharacterized protein n=2 Tax=Haloferax larsenii TaxID=302484 RepID=A0A1H7U6A9_HALLR|nr:hypothetical protein SAMN04488691_11182 [Haloferax larsenii]